VGGTLVLQIWHQHRLTIGFIKWSEIEADGITSNSIPTSPALEILILGQQVLLREYQRTSC